MGAPRLLAVALGLEVVGGTAGLGDEQGLSSTVAEPSGEHLEGYLAQHRGSLRAAVGQLLAGSTRIPGVGGASLRRLEAALTLGRCLALEELADAPVMSSPENCGKFLRQHFALSRREVFCCLFLDSRNRLLACRDLFFGTIDGAAVYPREVAVEALRLGANGVIAAHNHPSGYTEPSGADHRITERLRQALSLLDIRLLDHLIVGHGQVHSMARHGEAGF